MSRRLVILTTVVALVAMIAAPVGAETATPDKPHARAELIADVSAVAPGEPFRVGALFTIDPGWHVYWINPGDAGLPTLAEFTLPEGFSVAPTQYPAPTYFGAGTPLSGYGYEGAVLLFAGVTVPATIVGDAVRVSAKTSWLVCRETCIPGAQDVELALPVKPAAEPSERRALFDEAAASVPVAPPAIPGLAVSGMLDVTGVKPGAEFAALFAVKAPEGASIAPNEDIHRPFFIPGPMQNYELPELAPGIAAGEAKGEVLVRVKGQAFPGDAESERIGGVFQFRLTQNGETKPVAVTYDIELPRVGETDPVSPVAFPGAGGTVEAAPEPAPAAPAGPARVALMLLFAFVGGIILNVMPCVLPVISIKVMSLIQHANMTHSEMRRHGWAYTGGIVASFLLLATVVVVLKSGGEAVGWGFQFQSPLFVAGLAAVVFAFGLSMLGVFEIMGVSGDKLSKAENTTRRILKAEDDGGDHDSLAGSFVNGVFATVLATPCTAPFLGAALGFAFTQPLPIIVLTFVCVGLGLAFPFLLLAFVPAWTRFLPRPGDWMNTFKALMGFLLMATVVWLLDVLGKQVGATGLTQMLAFLAVLGLAAWVWGRFGNVMRSAKSRGRAGVVAALLTVAGAGLLLRFEPMAAAGAVTTDEHGITWKAFSEDEVRSVAAGGQTVFIDFTAAWCWTCKVNESAVINTDPVREVFKTHNVATFKGDWTNRDPAIGEYLRRHGRAGVPMYVVIPPGKPDAPIVLPEVITKDMVVEAIEKAASGV